MTDSYPLKFPKAPEEVAELQKRVAEAGRKNRKEMGAANAGDYQRYLADQAHAKEEAERERKFNEGLDRFYRIDPIDAPVGQQSLELCADDPDLMVTSSCEPHEIDAIETNQNNTETTSVEIDKILEDLDEEICGMSDEDAWVRECEILAAYDPEQLDDPKKIYNPIYYTRWDRLREIERLTEERLSKTVEGTTAHAIAKRQYDEALRLRKIEDFRDSDPTWRKRRETNRWRWGPGKPIYNAKRRKVRTEPNGKPSAMPGMDGINYTLSRKAGNSRDWRKRQKENKLAEKAKAEAEKAAALNGGPVITEGMFGSG